MLQEENVDLDTAMIETLVFVGSKYEIAQFGKASNLTGDSGFKVTGETNLAEVITLINQTELICLICLNELSHQKPNEQTNYSKLVEINASISELNLFKSQIQAWGKNREELLEVERKAANCFRRYESRWDQKFVEIS